MPKGKLSNPLYRLALLEAAADDVELQADLWQMCREDILFWVNTFVWTHDPRQLDSPALPFITYPFQDTSLTTMAECVGRESLLAEKSRDMGASWMFLMTFLWRWLFYDLQSFLVVSRNEKYVDARGNPKSLFYKLDFALARLPSWMMPNVTRIENHLQNDDNGSVIDGESTTGDVGAGGRATAVMADEFARFKIDDGFKAIGALGAVSNCKFWNSTHQGTGTAFYRIATKTPIRKLRMHWSEHPDKNRGLYTSSANGELVILDRSYPYATNSRGDYTYKFILDRKVRSPWYDAECAETLSNLPTLIATELDIDPGGSSHRVFPQSLLDSIPTREPFHTGELDYNLKTHEPIAFLDDDEGEGLLKLFFPLTPSGRPPYDAEYVMGVDIAAGTGSSNSAFAIYDKATGELAAEYANAHMPPERLADVAYAIKLFFNDAYLIWEANGFGRPFGKRILELGARNIFYRTDEASISQKVSLIPGWWATPETKRVLFIEYRRALAARECMCYSAEAVEELEHIIFLPGGGLAHDQSQGTIDPTGARDNHGDRGTANALGWHGMKAVRPAYEESERYDPEALPGSMAWRQKWADEQAQAKKAWRF